MITISSEVNKKALKDSYLEACKDKEFKKQFKILKVKV